jgi:hypothetical protein
MLFLCLFDVSLVFILCSSYVNFMLTLCLFHVALCFVLSFVSCFVVFFFVWYSFVRNLIVSSLYFQHQKNGWVHQKPSEGCRFRVNFVFLSCSFCVFQTPSFLLDAFSFTHDLARAPAMAGPAAPLDEVLRATLGPQVAEAEALLHQW